MAVALQNCYYLISSTQLFLEFLYIFVFNWFLYGRTRVSNEMPYFVTSHHFRVSKHWPSAEHLWNVRLFEEPPMILQSRPCFWIQHPSWSWKNIPIQLDFKFIGYMFVWQEFFQDQQKMMSSWQNHSHMVGK